ncbi:uncharacterized protein LOC133832317 [Humulus lupulus]|uniref:uncharacterized protein LOC133832317 n=1 Tax=Humulus lupulus TaxID=3486 RepID=UPI002B402095|nr:uncharacterized protein LOC133832317 [Humulus lupulus]
MNPPKRKKEVQCLTGRVAAINRFISRFSNKCLPSFDILKGSKRFAWEEHYERAFTKLKEHLGKPPLLAKPLKGEKLYLYLAVSEHAITAALVKGEKKHQQPVYYINKQLIDVETRYPEMEKSVYALVVASRKLCPYFHGHVIEVKGEYQAKGPKIVAYLIRAKG